MKKVATTSLPAVDPPNADRWNAARSRQLLPLLLSALRHNGCWNLFWGSNITAGLPGRVLQTIRVARGEQMPPVPLEWYCFYISFDESCDFVDKLQVNNLLLVPRGYYLEREGCR